MIFRVWSGRWQQLRDAGLGPRMVPALRLWHLMAPSFWAQWLGGTVLDRCLELSRGQRSEGMDTPL